MTSPPIDPSEGPNSLRNLRLPGAGNPNRRPIVPTDPPEDIRTATAWSWSRGGWWGSILVIAGGLVGLWYLLFAGAVDGTSWFDLPAGIYEHSSPGEGGEDSDRSVRSPSPSSTATPGSEGPDDEDGYEHGEHGDDDHEYEHHDYEDELTSGGGDYGYRAESDSDG